MTSFLTGVVQQRRTTVAILVGEYEDPGATRWIKTRHRRSATFRAVLVGADFGIYQRAINRSAVQILAMLTCMNE